MRKEKWGLEDIPDLTGKVIIITGGNSGLGYASAEVFTNKGAEVIIACRNLSKGEDAKKLILSKNPVAIIKTMMLDLMDLNSVKDFAKEFMDNYTRLDVLQNNAGIMAVPYSKTKNGFESQMATNHLGHFALTALLLDLILNTSGSRVVNVSSLAHKFGKIDFKNFMFEKGKYSPMKAYSRSKLANLLFTYELQRRFDIISANCIAVAAHPGASKTNLGPNFFNTFLLRNLRYIVDKVLQSAIMGALPQIRASVDRNVKGAEYYGPKGFAQMSGLPVLVKSNRVSYSIKDAEKLWEVSEELTGLNFNFKAI